MFFDLPSITVIGGQSAGKSSLVEAVSGIHVPRSSGTCTRCPMECTMSSSAESWSCNISLRFDHNTHGERTDPTTHDFGPTITDKNAVELYLRRAQAAILSPHIPPVDFLTKTEKELRSAPPDANRLAFSKNAVVVALKDPSLTDLSFVDLPGLIQNEDPAVIDVVRDLTVSRIEKKNTLVLVTIPMSDDLQNQQAARLAKDADPDGKRTIVALTKPDTLGSGATEARQKWQEIIEGKEHQLTHGYYCVRLPDDDERLRGVSRAESESRATEYFATTQPWRDIVDRSRFGVPNLAAFLSQLLIERIEANLPELKDKLNALLEKYMQDLRQLPAPPTSEAAAEVILKTTKFCETFKAAVFGDDHRDMAQNNRRLYLEFKEKIRSTGPDFRPFERHSSYVNPNIVDGDGIAITSVGEPLDLLAVRKVIVESTGWELPPHVPFRATQTLVLKFTSQFWVPSMSCFNAVVDSTSNILNDLRSSHFGQFKELENYVQKLTRSELENCKEEALETLEKLLSLEKLPLFTQNTHQLQSQSQHWLSRYAPFEETGRDDFADELALMANVRSYWQVAYQRIIDYVPLLIEHEFNQNLAMRLRETLVNALLKGPDASAKLQDLLVEDPKIASERALLEGRIARLLDMKQKLDDLA
ncbi:P-loop containing nucleoside triphosphate hydrolase protein [Mycena rebaudengoi]|nr:P-loop containing nucleoside triphosphate hydrolase protein [Mycena rebaudengoi]